MLAWLPLMVDDYQEDFYLKGENEYFEKVRIGFLEKKRNSHSDTIYLVTSFSDISDIILF